MQKAEPQTSGSPHRPRRSAVAAVATALLLVGGGAGTWLLLRDDPTSEAAAGAPVDDRLVEVSTATIGEAVTAQGTVANAETADLSFTVAGTVETVAVSAGDEVAAGQVLATIDSASLDAALAEAEAQLAQAEAALDDAEDSGADTTEINAAQASVQTAEDGVSSATEDLAGAQLVAEFDGLVAAVDLSVGEQLGSTGTGGTSMTGSGSGSGRSSAASTTSAGSAAQPGGVSTAGSGSSSDAQIQLISQGRFVVELSVAAADIDSVAVGQAVDLSISTTASSSTSSGGMGGFGPPGMQGGGGFGPPGMQSDSRGATPSGGGDAIEVEGAVSQVGRVADASSGVASYAVTVEFSDDSGDVWAGSSAEADIHVSDRADVTVVESLAVSSADGESTVTVAIDGTLDGATEERVVVTGETSGTSIEIVDGLEPGEQVVVTGPSFGGSGGAMPPGMSGSGGAMPGRPQMRDESDLSSEAGAGS